MTSPHSLRAALTFSAEISDLTAYLACLDSYETRDSHVRVLTAIIRTAMEAALDEQPPAEVISTMLREWRDAQARQEHAAVDEQARYAADAEASQREEDITRKVECPACGANPGRPCRTTGDARTRRSLSHRARWRAARHLHNPSPESP